MFPAGVYTGGELGVDGGPLLHVPFLGLTLALLPTDAHRCQGRQPTAPIVYSHAHLPIVYCAVVTSIAMPLSVNGVRV